MLTNSNNSNEREDPCPLEQKYNDLAKHYQSRILQTMEPKGLVSRRAINLPFDNLEEFDGSDAVTADTLIRKEKKVMQFVTMLMQRNDFEGLVRNEVVKQAKNIIREEQTVYTMENLAPEGQAWRQDFFL
jgi:hypothetical protein